MKKDYAAQNLEAYVRRVHGLREDDLFKSKKIDKRRKKAIINALFVKYTGYRLTSQGLKQKGGKDCFYAYKSFDDIKSYRHLESDITQTLKRSKSRIGTMKRKAHLKAKQKSKEKQQEQIEHLDNQAYLSKWDADTKKRREKLAQIKQKRERVQNNDVER